MLVLSRRHNEKILLPSVGASIEVLEIKGDRVRLGIDAPSTVTILREELADKQGLRSIADMRAAVEAATLEAREQRHLLRNQLNTATVGIAVARRQLEAGLIEQVAATLSKIGDGVQLLGQNVDKLVSAQQPVRTPTSVPRALLVEDDKNECQLLAGFFRMAGYQVATASDGADALDYLEHNEQPDVMLLDMMLPRCDGPTTIRLVRDRPQFSSLKIFAMSGYTPDQLGFDSQNAGVARWFQKPLNPEMILKELNAARREPICA
jgi:carbon storage regulator CsrA